MALIVRCKSCRKRNLDELPACPSCGGTDFSFAVDYWPKGRNGGRKQISLKVDSLEAARSMKQRIMAAKKKRPVVAASAFSTVSELFPSYLRWYESHRAATTFTDIKFAWKRLEPVLGDYRIMDVSAEHFSLYQQMRPPTPTNRSANKELEYFKGFLNWCRRERRIDVERIEYERLPYKRPLPDVLTGEEIPAFLEAAKAEPLWHAFFSCLYYLGLRFSEASNLLPSDFDFPGKTVKVRQKGGTDKILPLCKEVTGPIRKLARIRGCGPDDFLFVSRCGRGRPVVEPRWAIARICKEAGIKKRVYPHLFRHSVATAMVGRGVGIRVVQDFLGHKCLQNTEIYTHISMEVLRAAQGRVSTNKRVKSA